MSTINLFTYKINNTRSMQIRTYSDEKGNPWFLVADVLIVLGLTNATKACINLDEQEKSYLNRIQLGLNPGRPYVIISESGLYKLVMRSDKPIAKKFQDWVTKEVLPAIRKDGGYIMGEEKVKTGEMSEDELLLKAMTILTTKVQRLTSERDVLQAKVTEHLDFLTVDEWRALNHMYLEHGDKIRLGLRAKKLALESNVKVTKQPREITVISRTTGWPERRETSVNVFPAHILNQAASQLGFVTRKVV